MTLMVDEKGRKVKYAYIARDLQYRIISVDTTIKGIADKLDVKPSLIVLRLKQPVSIKSKLSRKENEFNIERIVL